MNKSLYESRGATERDFKLSTLIKSELPRVQVQGPRQQDCCRALP